jgi:hypothetical protein
VGVPFDRMRRAVIEWEGLGHIRAFRQKNNASGPAVKLQDVVSLFSAFVSEK